jgi:hypothetical protein
VRIKQGLRLQSYVSWVNHGSTPQHKLLVHAQFAKNPIVRGNYQTITVTIGDNTGRKVAGTNVHEEVLYVSGFYHTFPGITNSREKMIHSWKISGNADSGLFMVTVATTKVGYAKGSATSTFTVTPKP